MAASLGQLSQNAHQGYYGEVFVRALAVGAALVVKTSSIDVDGADMTVNSPGPRGTSCRPKIDVQVKSWRSPKYNRDRSALRYPLRVANYNQLISTEVHERFYLVVVVVPDDPSQFVIDGQDHSVLHRSAYWMSLEGRETSTKDDEYHETIEIPVLQRLTVQSLIALVEGRIGVDGGQP